MPQYIPPVSTGLLQNLIQIAAQKAQRQPYRDIAESVAQAIGSITESKRQAKMEEVKRQQQEAEMLSEMVRSGVEIKPFEKDIPIPEPYIPLPFRVGKEDKMKLAYKPKGMSEYQREQIKIQKQKLSEYFKAKQDPKSKFVYSVLSQMLSQPYVQFEAIDIDPLVTQISEAYDTAVEKKLLPGQKSKSSQKKEVKMKSPDGRILSVPSEDIEKLKKAGAVIIQ